MKPTWMPDDPTYGTKPNYSRLRMAHTPAANSSVDVRADVVLAF
jgi:hypothetical protein